MVAERISPGADGAIAGRRAPLVRGRAKARLKRAVHKGLIDSKAVATVRRVPGIGALAPLEDTERVGPARGLEPADPAVLLGVEGRHFLVEIDQSRVRVAHEESGAAPPRVRQAEH